MASKDHPNPSFAGRCKHLINFVGDLLSILDLLHDPYLHVIHDQRQSRWIANFIQSLRYIQSECPLHNDSTSPIIATHFTEGLARLRRHHPRTELCFSRMTSFSGMAVLPPLPT